MLAGRRRLRVADLLRLPAFAGARAATGDRGLDREVMHVNVMQVPTALFAWRGDLVLAADGAFSRSPTSPEELLVSLDDRAIAAVAARRSGLGATSERLVAAAAERGLALIELPDSAHLSEVLTGTLEALVASQASELRQAAAVREQLGDFVLGGGELDALPDVVAELADADVAVVGRDGLVLAASAGADREQAAAVAAAWLRMPEGEPAISDDGWVAWPVSAGAVQLGCLVARLPGAPEPVHLAVVEYGSNSAALEILHRQEAVDAHSRLREGFVEDLLSGSLEPDAVRRRAGALGWEAQGRYVVVLARGEETRAAVLAARVQAATAATVAVERRGVCLVIAPVSADGDEGEAAKVAQVLIAAGADVHVGISGELDSAADLPAGVAAAEEALRAAEAFDARGRVRTQGELGPLRLLAEVPAAELHAFADDALAALDAVEPERDGPLGATLRELLATGLNLAEAARRGGWHYNTVRYRLRRLEELLGPFMEDGALLQTLSLALLLRRELSPR